MSKFNRLNTTVRSHAEGQVTTLSTELSEREQIILRTIVQSYVLSASPVGSQMLSKQMESELKVSSATVRNVMANLEDLGYVSHPHTSAGRIPTDKGYRYYVDSLMMLDNLTRVEEQALRQNNCLAPREAIKQNAREGRHQEAGDAAGEGGVA